MGSEMCIRDRNSDQTSAWVKAQSSLTDSYLNAIPGRQALEKHLTKLWNVERLGVPSFEGGYYFFSKNNGLQNQSVLYSTKSLDLEPTVLQIRISSPRMAQSPSIPTRFLRMANISLIRPRPRVQIGLSGRFGKSRPGKTSPITSNGPNFPVHLGPRIAKDSITVASPHQRTVRK